MLTHTQKLIGKVHGHPMKTLSVCPRLPVKFLGMRRKKESRTIGGIYKNVCVYMCVCVCVCVCVRVCVCVCAVCCLLFAHMLSHQHSCVVSWSTGLVNLASKCLEGHLTTPFTGLLTPEYLALFGGRGGGGAGVTVGSPPPPPSDLARSIARRAPKLASTSKHS